MVDNDALKVWWPGVEATRFDTEFLQSLGDPMHMVDVGTPARPWTRDDIGDRVLHQPFDTYIDGTYSNDAPGLVGLHCHGYEATGGENVFVDGLAIVERLSSNSLSMLRDVEIPARYIGDGAHLMARRPALRFERDRLTQISYNHHDRAPFSLPEPMMTSVLDALGELDALANDPTLQLELSLRPGDMVLFDNWRLLHGRRAFSGQRLIAGGYINREDVESTTRRLAAG